MTAAIEIEGLRKEYRGRRGAKTIALGGLDLTVPEGGVFGFCGPNGSGKTTTIRCLLGLVSSTGGSMQLLGKPVPSGLAESLRATGSIVEAPALFPTMTARGNLRLLAAIGGVGHRQVDDVLEEVGLAERSDDLVSKYSLGMRQRLALAAALLKDPALIVLDEPTNGLDPAGIQQVRALMRRLGHEGRTVFVSSHLLSEVEQTCDRVAILNKGTTVVQGDVGTVLGASGQEIIVRLEDLDAGQRSLERAGITTRLVDSQLRVKLNGAGRGDVTRILAADQLWVTEMREMRRSLEDVFLELTTDQGARP